jgi:hypothetical protein
MELTGQKDCAIADLLSQQSTALEDSYDFDDIAFEPVYNPIVPKDKLPKFRITIFGSTLPISGNSLTFSTASMIFEAKLIAYCSESLDI